MLDAPDGERLVAWWLPPRRDDAPVFLYLHGNASNLGARALRLARLASGGAGVLALSWRGYGGSTGRAARGRPDHRCADRLCRARSAGAVLAHRAVRRVAGHHGGGDAGGAAAGGSRGARLQLRLRARRGAGRLPLAAGGLAVAGHLPRRPGRASRSACRCCRCTAASIRSRRCPRRCGCSRCCRSGSRSCTWRSAATRHRWTGSSRHCCASSARAPVCDEPACTRPAGRHSRYQTISAAVARHMTALTPLTSVTRLTRCPSCS